MNDINIYGIKREILEERMSLCGRILMRAMEEFEIKTIIEMEFIRKGELFTLTMTRKDK